MRRPVRVIFREYVKAFAILAGIALGLIAALGVVVDPHHVFNLFHSTRLDAAKTSRGTRMYKAEQVRRGTWDVVVLGNSRVEAGIDPASTAWPAGRRVFNAGLSGL